MKDDKLGTNDEEIITNTPCDENKNCKECENYSICYSTVIGVLNGSGNTPIISLK